ncbi:MAG: hypothetical protein P4L31_00245 [Candidatus Babeliales bacterium]|nr:hypothetical protein [Candidatus Babeliales bacterium]
MNVSRSLRIIVLTLLTTFSVGTIVHGAQPAPAAPTLFQETPTLPEERAKVAILIDSRLDEVFKKLQEEGQCIACDWLPGYFIKKNTSRIAGAQALQKCITDHKLNLLRISEKWVYEMPAQYKEQGYPNLVIAKKIEEKNGHVDTKIIDLEQAKQICTLLKHAQYDNCYYADTHSGNFLHCSDGRIGLIDTERLSWGYSNKDGMNNLLMFQVPLAKDAKAFIEKKLRKTKVREQ